MIKFEFVFKYHDFTERIKIVNTPYVHLLEEHIMNQVSSIEGGISDKTEDHIERNHQDDKRFERRCKCVSDFT